MFERALHAASLSIRTERFRSTGWGYERAGRYSLAASSQSLEASTTTLTTVSSSSPVTSQQLCAGRASLVGHHEPVSSE